jgi:hypothetical protein
MDGREEEKEWEVDTDIFPPETFSSSTCFQTRQRMFKAILQ